MDLEALAPPGSVVVALADHGQPLDLPPGEAQLVAGSVEKRRRDFALGRTCARAALARLGHDGWVLGRAPSGAPLWPAGIVGSITHTKAFAAAMAAPADRFRAIGIDAECSGGVDDRLGRRLFTDGERAWLSGQNDEGRPALATLLFSAKEAYFKAFHPLEGWMPDFRQVEVEVVPGTGVFSVRQPDARDGWAAPVPGRFVIGDGLVVTALCLEA